MGKTVENTKETVPVWEKLNLTVKEAAEYSNLGVNKIYELIRDPGCTFVLRVGKRNILIKREKFKRFLDNRLNV